jgi:hypothetical protein
MLAVCAERYEMSLYFDEEFVKDVHEPDRGGWFEALFTEPSM